MDVWTQVDFRSDLLQKPNYKQDGSENSKHKDHLQQGWKISVTVPLPSIDVELHAFNAVLSFVSRQTKWQVIDVHLEYLKLIKTKYADMWKHHTRITQTYCNIIIK